MNKDLTVGSVPKTLVTFCLPLLGSTLFQQFYNLADSVIAGKFLGQAALAACGNGHEVTLFFLSVALGCGVGCSVVVSRLFGAKRYSDVKTAASTAFLAFAALCAVLVAVGLPLVNPLLSLLRTPDRLVADSALYLRVYLYGLPFVFFYNASVGAFAALGDSATPFLFLVGTSLSNVGLDVLFVVRFSLGVAGVAWATFLCQGVGCVLSFVLLLRRLKKLPAPRAPVFSRKTLRDVLVVALPSVAQQCFISVGNVAIQGVVNPFGESVMAGYVGAAKLNNLVTASLFTVGNGVSNFTAQNLGADKAARVRRGFFAGLVFLAAVAAFFALLYVFAGKYLLRAFLPPTGEATQTGVRFLTLVAPFYPVAAVKIAADGILRGAGKMGRFAFSTLLDVALRVAFAFLLSAPFGTDGVWSSWSVGWVASAALSLLFACFVLRSLKNPPQKPAGVKFL